MRSIHTIAVALMALFAVCFIPAQSVADHPFDIDTGGHESTTNTIGGDDGDQKESFGTAQSLSTTKDGGNLVAWYLHPGSWLAAEYLFDSFVERYTSDEVRSLGAEQSMVKWLH